MKGGTSVNHAAQQTVGAHVSLKRRRPMAAGLAGELGTSRRRLETGLGDTRVQAEKGCCAKEPHPCLHHPVEPAALANNGLQNRTDFGDELLVHLKPARRDQRLAHASISGSTPLGASAGVSAPELEALPQPRAIHDAGKGLAATRRWHTLTRAQGTPSSVRPRR
jgi:hypothetical protein